jgi:predicted ATPase
MTPDSELRSGLANLLYRRSEGNPLFMVAALEHSVEQGSLVTEDGQLQLRIPLNQLDLGIPQSLKRILEAQIDHLETEERLSTSSPCWAIAWKWGIRSRAGCHSSITKWSK